MDHFNQASISIFDTNLVEIYLVLIVVARPSLSLLPFGIHLLGWAESRTQETVRNIDEKEREKLITNERREAKHLYSIDFSFDEH